MKKLLIIAAVMLLSGCQKQDNPYGPQSVTWDNNTDSVIYISVYKSCNGICIGPRQQAHYDGYTFYGQPWTAVSLHSVVMGTGKVQTLNVIEP